MLVRSIGLLLLKLIDKYIFYIRYCFLICLKKKKLSRLREPQVRKNDSHEDKALGRWINKVQNLADGKDNYANRRRISGRRLRMASLRLSSGQFFICASWYWEKSFPKLIELVNTSSWCLSEGYLYFGGGGRGVLSKDLYGAGTLYGEATTRGQSPPYWCLFHKPSSDFVAAITLS